MALQSKLHRKKKAMKTAAREFTSIEQVRRYYFPKDRATKQVVRGRQRGTKAASEVFAETA